MKKIIFLIVLTISISANHISWRGDYNLALKEAKEKHKILMVLLIKSNCFKCKEVVKNIFTNKKYIDKLNQKVIGVIVNIDNRDSYPIELYWSNIYPTLFFVDSNSERFIYEPIYNLTYMQNIKLNIPNKYR